MQINVTNDAVLSESLKDISRECDEWVTGMDVCVRACVCVCLSVCLSVCVCACVCVLRVCV
jgi:hypothetical protein